MGRTYYHNNKEKLRSAGRKGAERTNEIILQKRICKISEYNGNPNVCRKCKNPLAYEKRNNQFCSHSCRAKVTNKHRKTKKYQLSEKGLNNIRNSNNMVWKKQKNHSVQIYEKSPKFCSICNSKVSYEKRNRQTCSKECYCTLKSNQAKLYFGGNYNSNSGWYESSIAGRVHLESSYEFIVASELDKYGIDWIRPKFVIWKTDQGEVKKYFPDFYLPQFDVYLDPKNNFLIEKDSIKIKKVQEQNNITIFVLTKNELTWDKIKLRLQSINGDALDL